MTNKLKIYLDTNILYGFFKSIVETLIKGKDYRENKRVKFIEHNLDKLEPITSNITFLEVAKGLKKEYKELTNEKILKLIEFFWKFAHIEMIRDVRLTDSLIKYFLEGMEFRDCIQLEIAKNESAMLVTDDTKLLEKGIRFYSNIFNYKTLKKFVT